MREYRRQRGARPYLTNYAAEDLENAIKSVRGGETIGKAAARFGVPKSTLYRKVKAKQLKKNGGQLSLTEECELSLLAVINQVTDWKVPFDGYDVRLLVKHYLDKRGVSHKRFKDNLPGPDWLRGFTRRRNLVLRLADNVKPAKFVVDEASVNVFFDNITQTLQGVPPENIFNFDETNMTDDPSRKKCIVRRGLRRVERKVSHSKQGFSVMFSGSAAGVYLPPMVVYKVASENVYDSWMEGGPRGALYASTKSGWFNTVTFERWFFEVFLPHVQHLIGPKVLIGDNLGCHFSTDVIKSCRQHDIRFTALLPNATHLMQPLDVAVFRPMKVSWRKVLLDWRKETRIDSTIPKDQFPTLLYRVVGQLQPQHLSAGFTATGISPLDRQKVIVKLPGNVKPSSDPGGSATVNVLNESCLEILRKHCKPPTKIKRKPRGRKVKVIPGKVIQTEREITWVCQFCFGNWEEDDNRWIVCDVCDDAFHLQCSGVQYITDEYDDFDIESIEFRCDRCRR